jgi:hypothetical protein
MARPTFSTMPDIDMTLQTRHDIGRHCKFNCRSRNRKWKPEVVITLEQKQPMSDNVGDVIFGSGMVEYVGVAVGIASKSVSVQKLFPLPVSTSGFVEDILVSHVSRCRTMSAMSYSSRAYSKIWG